MNRVRVFLVGAGPIQGVYLLECDPTSDRPPAVSWILADPGGDQPNSAWVQADRANRRVEVDGEWLPLYYYIEPGGQFSIEDPR